MKTLLNLEHYIRGGRKWIMPKSKNYFIADKTQEVKGQ